VTAVTQLAGNVALVSAFRAANFAQSIVLHKLEVVFAALVGALWFAEYPTLLGWGGVVACSVGVLLLNFGRRSGPNGWRRAVHVDRASLLALLCGLLLVFASFALKAANEEFAACNPRVGAARFEAAAHTLFHTTWLEVVALSLWIGARMPAEFRHVRVWGRRMLLIGVTAFGGSLCWFWAYSLALVTYVKAVGQIEAVLAVLIALRVFGEREVLRQLPGVVLILLGILLVNLG
jgi:drug/metabolite transporter (DMT)-like permease